MLASRAGFVALAVILFPPWRPAMPSAGLDPAWIMVLGRALSEGWQFGRDVVFTYGPLGALAVPSFYPGLFPIAAAFWIAFSVTFALGFCALYRRARWSWWIFAFVAVLCAGLSLLQDARVFAAAFMLFLIGRSAGRAALSIAVTLTVLLAACALMKMTYMAAAVPLVVLTDLIRFKRWRAPPMLTPLFGAAYILAYVAAGQDLANLWLYLTTAREISSGYNDAMSTNGSMGEIVAFALSATAALALVGWSEIAEERRGRLWETALTLIAFAVVIFLAAKAGFVRNDIGHTLIAWLSLLLMLAAYLGEMCRFTPARRTVAVGLSAVVLVFFARQHVAATSGPHGVTAQAVSFVRDTLGRVRENAAAAGTFAFKGQYAQLLLEWPEFLKNIRNDHPLPTTTGTVDISGGDQAILLAHGLPYRPRPVFQSYSVYTPALIQRNIAFLRSDAAPSTFLLKVFSIDGRVPALDEGALWPDLLRLYDIVDVAHGYAVFERRAVPREVALTTLRETALAWSQPLDLAGVNDGPLWIEIDIKPSFAGRFLSLLTKPPQVGLTVNRADGVSAFYRLIPGMASEGFFLSPFIERSEQLLTLSQTDVPRVDTVVVNPGFLAGLYFKADIRVRFKAFRISGENEHPRRSAAAP